MRKILLTLFCALIVSSWCQAQTNASDVLKKLSEMPDQFDNKWNGAVEDELILIYVPGANNPFQKIYLKQKASNVQENVLLVGGFKEMMSGMSFASKKEHLQEALALQYKKGSTILMDMDSEIGTMLGLNGYSIVTLSKSQNKVLKIDDFGYDRVAFFKALKKYEKAKPEESND